MNFETTDLSKSQKVEEIAAQYMSLKSQIDQLEKQKDQLRKSIEQMVISEPEMKMSTETYNILLSECSRENFDLKTARVALGNEVVGKFVKVTNFKQLRVTKK
jgi:hypothetical protein